MWMHARIVCWFEFRRERIQFAKPPYPAMVPVSCVTLDTVGRELSQVRHADVGGRSIVLWPADKRMAIHARGLAFGVQTVGAACDRRDVWFSWVVAATYIYMYECGQLKAQRSSGVFSFSFDLLRSMTRRVEFSFAFISGHLDDWERYQTIATDDDLWLDIGFSRCMWPWVWTKKKKKRGNGRRRRMFVDVCSEA